ncbi:MAG: SpoIIE family protein phosphatase [Clostridia bacterium]|nr:SpoIIE family protein phosphatase [Clostridia bacterium]
MGSGQTARKASKTAVNMLGRMLSSGFDKDTSLQLINSSMYTNWEEDSYATLDVAIFDLYLGNMEFMKNGACPTFIKNKRDVSVVKSVSLPTRNT